MTFDELESFVAIATGGGFTDASKKLHRSQPAISRRIRQLEQSLDARVFERAGRGVRLTEAGRRCCRTPRLRWRRSRDGRRAVKALAGEDEGRARAAARDRGHARRSLPRARAAPLPDPLRRRVDRAAHRDEPRSERARAARRGATWACATSPIRIRSSSRSRSAASGSRWWSPRGASHPRRSAWRACAPSRARPGSASRPIRATPSRRARCCSGSSRRPALANPSLTPVDSLTAQKRLVEAGLGIALLPLSSVREELRRGTLRSIAVSRLRADQPVVAVQRRAATAIRSPRRSSTCSNASTPELRS